MGCTVHCHGKKETRTAVIKVNGIFFDRFAGSTLSGWSAASGNSAVLRSGRLETQVSATNTTDSAGSVTKSFGVSAFFPPASITSSLGIVVGPTNANTPKFPVSSANPTWDNFLGFGLTGSDPGVDLSPTYYISEIRVDWWPTTHIQNTVTYYAPEDDPELPAFRTINDTDFNARVAVRWTRRADIGAGIQAYSGWFMTFFDAPALTHDGDVNKVMGLAIDEDYKVFVYVGGTEVFSTTAIQTWQSTHADCPFQISQVKYLYPNYTRVYMNNVVGNNTTELLY